jgi:hypothetical protein
MDIHARLDPDSLPPFPPARLTEKLRDIRERLKLTPDQFAPLVGVATGAEIEGYEKDLGHEPNVLLVTTLWRYVKVAGVPIENLMDDGRDLWLGHRVN